MLLIILTYTHTQAWGTLTHTLAKRGPAHVEAKRDNTTTKRLKAKQIENLTTTSQLFVASLSTLTSTAASVGDSDSDSDCAGLQQLPAPVALIGAANSRGSCANSNPRRGILSAWLRPIGSWTERTRDEARGGMDRPTRHDTQESQLWQCSALFDLLPSRLSIVVVVVVVGLK